MRVLITGITGMAGSHLAEYLLEAEPGVQITGSVRWRSRMQDLAAIERHLRLVECDVRDRASVDRLMAQARPDFCFHLAAQSSVSASFHSPSETLVTNISGLVNVLESLRLHAPDCRVLVPGSSEEYGASEGLVDERSPLLPLSPYAVSKVTQDLIGFQYHQSYKLHIIRMRAFNHTGPRRPALYAESDFARQIAAIEGGAEPVIRVGNLEAVRDYTDVRDVVRAYWLALEHCPPGQVYNICSGRAWRIGDVLEFLLSRSRVRVRIEEDPERLRPSDVPILEGSYARFHEATGWRPEIPLEQTFEDLLDYWRQRV